eukprot:TRINITY_DN1131_c0_g1_i1.p1 TRINITY_DN1131_c0_g1~~TRINITY_DN1131_c0_g1_i1.p1  ORF type:complete len:630 (+),score=100.13 TRINITY_DN1131_c0_g1_i1:2-1891(+)
MASSGSKRGFGQTNPPPPPLEVAFVPRAVVDHFVKSPVALTKPHNTSFSGSLLFADISGFTHMAEYYTEKYGRDGVGYISEMLNEYFEMLIRQLGAFGGDVIKFAGDALVCVFRTTPVLNLPTCCLIAIQCGLALAKSKKTFEDGTTLTLHVGIGAGDLTDLHMGGVQKRWEYLVVGSPLTQASNSEGLSKSGEVVVSPEVYNYVSTLPNGVKMEKRKDKVEGYVVRSVATQVAPVLNEVVHSTAALQQIRPFLRGYIPTTLHPKLDTSQGSANTTADWLAESRDVTILFFQWLSEEQFAQSVEKKKSKLKQAEVTPVVQKAPIEKMDAFLRLVQEQLFVNEGALRQFIVDDKGCVLIAAFGLPGQAQQGMDAAFQAVTTAITVVQRASPDRVFVGVTTGRCFVGVVGLRNFRSEYAMVGASVNMSARLMSHAKKNDINPPVILDASTRRILTTSGDDKAPFELVQLPPFKVKGRDEPVEAYTAAPKSAVPPKSAGGSATTQAAAPARLSTMFAENHAPASLSARTADDDKPPIGRSVEMKALEEAVQKNFQEHSRRSHLYRRRTWHRKKPSHPRYSNQGHCSWVGSNSRRVYRINAHVAPFCVARCPGPTGCSWGRRGNNAKTSKWRP